jgi:putative hydrolase of HD superfamily
MERLDQQLGFISEVDGLKAVLRQTMLPGPGRRENSAEHSWHLAMMALTLGEYAPPGTDLAKVTSMLLLHDLVEIDAGDLFVYADQAQQEAQDRAERAAADRIFGLLPPDQATRLRELWDEFEERVTAEARFARALDRLQPMLANIKAYGWTWHKHGITADQVLAKVALVTDGSPELGRYATRMVADAVADGLLAPAPRAKTIGFSSPARPRR